VDTNNGLGLSLDTLEVTRFGEVEVNLGGTELLVRPSGILLCKGFEVTPVPLKLAALVVDDMLNNVIKEAGIMRDKDGDARRVDQVLLEPLDILSVHVVGRLVEKKDIEILEHGTGKSQLHPPTIGKRGDRSIELLL